MGFLKWLFKRQKTEADLIPHEEVVEIEETLQKRTEFGRVKEKWADPGPSPKFTIEYGPKYEPKPKHKVLMPNGIVLHSEWYTHPTLGSDGWMKQPPHFSLPKIEKMIEKDKRAREKNK